MIFGSQATEFSLSSSDKQAFHVKDHSHSLSEKLGPNWKWLGRQLKIEEHMISNIEAENLNDLPEQAYQLLCRWRETKSSAATLVELTKALNVIGCCDIAESLQKHAMNVTTLLMWLNHCTGNSLGNYLLKQEPLYKAWFP